MTPATLARRRRPAALGVLLALAVAACGTGGDVQVRADRSTTTTVDRSPTGAEGQDRSGDDAGAETAGRGDEAPTTEPGADAPGTEELEALLPTADDIGLGYSVDPDSADDGDDDGDDDPETDRAVEEACPAWADLEAIDAAQETTDDDAGAAFRTADDRTVEVTLSPTLDGFTEDQLDPLLEAVNACRGVTVDVDGAAMKIRMSGERVDIGDFGMRFSLDATIETVMGELPLHGEGILFARDGVSVAVFAASGFDESNFEEVPADVELLVPLARDLDAAVDDLVA